jgi:hypothetical protein
MQPRGKVLNSEHNTSVAGRRPPRARRVIDSRGQGPIEARREDREQVEPVTTHEFGLLRHRCQDVMSRRIL